MAQTKITWSRLLQVRKRQSQNLWAGEYLAGIQATPREAPGISTATILRPSKLGRRELHTLSHNETCAALLALYHPHCFQIFDQLALSPTPRPHLLFGHPKADGLSLPSFKGTVDVAERMGRLSQHPKVRAQITSDQASWPWVPFPYFGDLTLCLEDSRGPYVVDWPIKDKSQDFRRRGPKAGRTRPDRDDPGTVARNHLQATYFRDAGIRTQQVVGTDIDFDLRCNLMDLFQADAYGTAIPVEVRSDIADALRETVGQDIPAYETARRLSRLFKVEAREIIDFLKLSIWNRIIRVDLFRPVLSDYPLRPEVEDPLTRYAAWFER